MVECICGIEFTPKDADQIYHSVPCARESRAKTIADSALKVRFMGRCKARGLTRRAAGDQAGINYSALRTWLTTPQSRLGPNNLALVATWLGISVDHAIRLQGGAAEERRKALALVGLETHHQQVRADPKFKRSAADAVERMAKAVRGTHFSEEHRKRLSAGLKAYREKPICPPECPLYGRRIPHEHAHKMHVLGEVTDPKTGKTMVTEKEKLALKLMTVLRNRQKGDPDMMERRELALQQQQRDPLRPLAEIESERFGVCIETVISSWKRQLEKQGASSIEGRPANAERCDKLRAYLDTRPRLYGMWKSAPGDLATARWSDGHEHVCPSLRRALLQVRRANPTETSSRAV